MAQKRNAIELTQRELDIFICMLERAKVVLDLTTKRICLPPAQIRDLLIEKYPEIKVFNVVSSQKNIEEAGLISKIPDAGDGKVIAGKNRHQHLGLMKICMDLLR